MANPLIVGASKITGSSSKKASRNSHTNERRNPQQRRGSYRGRKAGQDTRQQTQIHKRGIPPELELQDATDNPATTKKLKQVVAARAGYMILWTIIPALYIPQLIFWLFSIGGIGIELIPLLKDVFPGMELFLLAHALIILIGLGSMVYAWVIFNRSLVDCTGGMKLFIFIACSTGYFVYFLNIIPFVAIWVMCVIYLQEGKSTEG